MAEWQSGAPPLEREIEYERDGRVIERGSLLTAGQFGMGANAANAAARMRQQYRRVDAEQPEMFEVTRWRELDEPKSQ